MSIDDVSLGEQLPEIFEKVEGTKTKKQARKSNFQWLERAETLAQYAILENIKILLTTFYCTINRGSANWTFLIR